MHYGSVRGNLRNNNNLFVEWLWHFMQEFVQQFDWSFILVIFSILRKKNNNSKWNWINDPQICCIGTSSSYWKPYKQRVIAKLSPKYNLRGFTTPIIFEMSLFESSRGKANYKPATNGKCSTSNFVSVYPSIALISTEFGSAEFIKQNK